MTVTLTSRAGAIHRQSNLKDGHYRSAADVVAAKPRNVARSRRNSSARTLSNCVRKSSSASNYRPIAANCWTAKLVIDGAAGEEPATSASMSRSSIHSSSRTGLGSKNSEEFISLDNPDAAARLLLSIREKMRAGLASAANGQESLLICHRNCAKFPVGNYLVFYRPAIDGIEVIRVLHGARDIPELFD